MGFYFSALSYKYSHKREISKSDKMIKVFKGWSIYYNTSLWESQGESSHFLSHDMDVTEYPNSRPAIRINLQIFITEVAVSCSDSLD